MKMSIDDKLCGKQRKQLVCQISYFLHTVLKYLMIPKGYQIGEINVNDKGVVTIPRKNVEDETPSVRFA